MKNSALFALVAAAFVGTGCGGAKPVVFGEEPWRTRPLDHGPARADVPALFPLLVATGPIDGPHLARRGAKSAVAWLGSPEGGRGEREIWIAPMDDRGSKQGPAISLGTTPKETTQFALRTTGLVTRPSFVALYTSLEGVGEVLHARVVASSATKPNDFRAAGQVVVGGGEDRVIWFDAVPTDRGFAVAWAEETADGTVRVSVRPFDGAGAPLSVARAVATNATGWALAPLGESFALATIRPTGNDGGSRVYYASFSSEGVSEESSTLSGTEGAVAPLAFGPTERGAILAFGNGRDVFLAADEGVRLAMKGARLVDGAFGARAGWLVVRPSSGEPAALVPIAADGEPSAPIALPDLPTAEGLSAYGEYLSGILPAARCEQASACTAPQRFSIRFGETSVRTVPIVAGADPIPFAWGIDCGMSGCLALASQESHGAAFEAETHVGTFQVVPASEFARVPAASAKVVATAPVGTAAGSGGPPDAVPRATNASEGPKAQAAPAPAAPPALGGETRTALVQNTDVVSFAEGADAGHPGRNLLAWVARKGVTTGTPQTPGSGDSRVFVAPWRPGSPTPLGAPLMVTDKAVGDGQVAMALARDPKRGAAVAWVGDRNGDPEVHVTRIDGSGRRQLDVQLTAIKGSASDVALAAVDGGWLVAWIDGRTGKPEVFAARVDYELRRTTREERISPLAQGAADLSLASNGTDVWATFVDGPAGAANTVHLAHIGVRDAKRIGDLGVVFQGTKAARTPVVALSRTPAADGTTSATVAWRQSVGAQSQEAAHASSGLQRGLACILHLPAAECKRPLSLGAEDSDIAAISLDPVRLGRGTVLRRTCPGDGPQAAACAGALTLFDTSAVKDATVPWLRAASVEAPAGREFPLLAASCGGDSEPAGTACAGATFVINEPTQGNISRLSFPAP